MFSVGDPVRNEKFPSPQGGSETSSADFTFGLIQLGFHPLKAGRRPFPSISVQVYCVSFHPLKAGRRPRGKAGKRGQKGGRVAVDLR